MAAQEFDYTKIKRIRIPGSFWSPWKDCPRNRGVGPILRGQETVPGPPRGKIFEFDAGALGFVPSLYNHYHKGSFMHPDGVFLVGKALAIVKKDPAVKESFLRILGSMDSISGASKLCKQNIACLSGSEVLMAPLFSAHRLGLQRFSLYWTVRCEVGEKYETRKPGQCKYQLNCNADFLVYDVYNFDGNFVGWAGRPFDAWAVWSWPSNREVYRDDCGCKTPCPTKPPGAVRDPDE